MTWCFFQGLPTVLCWRCHLRPGASSRVWGWVWRGVGGHAFRWDALCSGSDYSGVRGSPENDGALW